MTTLVHCSAGCGRTGTFCVIDTIINYIEQKRAQQYGEMNDDFDSDPIFEITNHYRKLRISMVQTLTQYYMIYEALLDYYCKMVAIMNKGENFKNGKWVRIKREQNNTS